jgi:hypothetical protein
VLDDVPPSLPSSVVCEEPSVPVVVCEEPSAPVVVCEEPFVPAMGGDPDWLLPEQPPAADAAAVATTNVRPTRMAVRDESRGHKSTVFFKVVMSANCTARTTLAP